MPMPRVYVLVHGQLAGDGQRQHVADKDKWPMEPGLTTDLGKARAWNHPPGVRRWMKRHAAAFPELAQCKREMVNEDLVEAARAAVTGTPNKRAKAKPAKRPKTKSAEVRKVSRKVATPRPRKRAKVAKAA